MRTIFIRDWSEDDLQMTRIRRIQCDGPVRTVLDAVVDREARGKIGDRRGLGRDARIRK